MTMPSNQNTPLRVCVTGAAGQIAYSLLPHIASGAIFGAHQKVELLLLDIMPAIDALKGVVMELEDCSYPLLAGITATFDPMEAFHQVDVAFLVGAMPRKQGMQRKGLLKANASIFKAQGQALDQVAKKNVKVLVVGNPANTNAFITRHYAPSIPAKNFSALTRLDENRSKGMISARLGVPVEQIKNMVIWGNHSATQYPDPRHGYIQDYPEAGQTIKVVDAVKDMNFLQGPFVKEVQTRGAAVIKARKLSSALSAAKAIADHMHDWWQGTPAGEHVCMAVPSDGSYGIPAGIVFSFPVHCQAGEWTIAQGLQTEGDAFATDMVAKTLAELQEERDEAMLFLDAPATA